MTIIVCVSNYWQERYYFELTKPKRNTVPVQRFTALPISIESNIKDKQLLCQPKRTTGGADSICCNSIMPQPIQYDIANNKTDPYPAMACTYNGRRNKFFKDSTLYRGSLMEKRKDLKTIGVKGLKSQIAKKKYTLPPIYVNANGDIDFNANGDGALEVDVDIDLDTTSKKSLKRKNSGNTAHTVRRLQHTIDAFSAFYFLRELVYYKNFREMVVTKLTEHAVDLLWLQLEPPRPQNIIIDHTWDFMLKHLIWEKIEVENLMAWLSTLGGGYSALGEQFERCADIAGKISLKQLAIGWRLGDPYLQTRCKLYFSISLIQRGRLRAAKYIVREQYAFAILSKDKDPRLVNMCLGIWRRLQYEYSKRFAEQQHCIINNNNCGMTASNVDI